MKDIDQHSRDLFLHLEENLKHDDNVYDVAEFGRDVLEADEKQQMDVLRLAFRRKVEDREAGIRHLYPMHHRFYLLVEHLLKSKLPLHQEHWIEIIDHSLLVGINEVPAKALIGAIEKQLKREAASSEMQIRLKALVKDAEQNLDDDWQFGKRVQALWPDERRPGELDLRASDAWTHAFLDALKTSSADPVHWAAWIDHCAGATQAKPSPRWLEKAQSLIEPILEAEDEGAYFAIVEQALQAAGTRAPASVGLLDWAGRPMSDDPTLLADQHVDVLRGFIWSYLLFGERTPISLLGEVAARCFKKVSGRGPRNGKIGNACLLILGQVSSKDAIGQISRLKAQIKNATIRNQIHKILQQAAERAGLTMLDLEELSVPRFGLQEVGRRVDVLGDFKAELESDGMQVALRWRTADGKVRKGVPKAIKDNHADTLKALKAATKELRSFLPALRLRLERLLLSRRSIPFVDWRQRYLDHPLVGTLTRRLIWTFGEGEDAIEAGLDGGALINLDGQPLEPEDGAPVRLWHPVDRPAEIVLAWREWLADREITQPFKQAHREIYLLTEAERQTETYSNRFAAHILKQHQFRALAQQRGWRYDLQGVFDSYNIPFLDLSDLGFTVEYRVAVMRDFDEMSNAGMYSYITTGQVRFGHPGEREPTPIVEVPSILFSEVMRDVDLFVGVASVGNDPTWQDGGVGGAFQDYWTDFAFGDLSETAKTRQAVLQNLIPKLKIAERCTLEDRFLVVRGELRTYRIHLGSSNVQMSPNNQYLCIVEQSKKSDPTSNLFLPFEGDSTLSLILSKAFYLAEDTKIKDPLIVSQIQN